MFNDCHWLKKKWQTAAEVENMWPEVTQCLRWVHIFLAVIWQTARSLTERHACGRAAISIKVNSFKTYQCHVSPKHAAAAPDTPIQRGKRVGEIKANGRSRNWIRLCFLNSFCSDFWVNSSPLELLKEEFDSCYSYGPGLLQCSPGRWNWRMDGLHFSSNHAVSKWKKKSKKPLSLIKTTHC